MSQIQSIDRQIILNGRTHNQCWPAQETARSRQLWSECPLPQRHGQDACSPPLVEPYPIQQQCP